MWNANVTWRNICSTFGLLGFLIWSVGTTTIQAAAGSYGWCYEECDSEADCAMECENDGGGTITCGVYDGGAGQGWCDGDTCNTQCTPTSAPGEECWLAGELSDCSTYGVAAYCGDDICENISNDEDCDNCEVDCGECPIPPPCGNSECEYGETYVTCPQDCFDPGPQGSCGDGICSEEDAEDWETCFLDCVMPNERCEDDFDCGAGYTCLGGGQPFGGQCVLFERLVDLDSCVTNEDCELGYICVQVEVQPDPGYVGRCIWFWEGYSR